MDWVSCYYLWIVKEWAAGPPDILDYPNDIKRAMEQMNE